jgi:predicted hydrocarbon binding protein
MEYSRSDLFLAEATMNQMRNSIYYLVRLMEKKGKTDVIPRLRNMGRNIARTFVKYWKPIEIVNVSNIKDFLKTIYQKIVDSSISIEMNNDEKIIIIKDYKCSLCKYKYDDINIAGCEILLGLVSELISLINEESKDPSSIFLEPLEVKESRSYGNNLCMHMFKFKIGGS